ncbi:MAG: MT-A70 family methyltransferase [Acidobacteria bacterium]|nr:MT-A70 family methyltransferase [Acidobacteriota bacterium]
MAARLSKAMISALRQLAGDDSQPRPWGGTLDSLERRGLVTRNPADPFDATLTEAGKAMAAEHQVDYIYQRAATHPPTDETQRQDTTYRTGVPMASDTTQNNDLESAKVSDSVSHQSLPNSASLYTVEFNSAWKEAVRGVVMAGDVVAKAQIKFGDRLWRVWVEDHLPVGVRQAQRLMRIARSPSLREALRQSEIADRMPNGIRALEALSGLHEETMRDLVHDGVLTPETSSADIKAAMVRRTAPPDPSPQLRRVADGRYGALLADPPWPFETWGQGGNGRGAEQHYPTMTIPEIAQLPVRDIAGEDSLLFLWCVSNHLGELKEIMKWWGFELTGIAFTWRKMGAPGMGYWTRRQTETCYLGRRGSPRRLSKAVPELIEAPRGAHSAKPAEVRERIQALVGGPYLEMFAREAVDGWDAWGHLEGGGRWEQ